MPITLDLANLNSRKTRTELTQELNGKRILDLASSFLESTDDQGNVIARFFQFAANKFGFILKVISRALSNINFTEVFGWLVNGYYSLVNFDWNQSDVELRENIKNARLGLLSVLGDTVGQAIGWTASIAIGYGIALTVPVIGGSVLAKFVSSRVLAEAGEELTFQFLSLVQQLFYYSGQMALTETYIKFRSYLKKLAASPTGRGILGILFGEERAATIAKQWGAANAPTLTMANFIETRVEKLPLNLETFVDAFLEGIEDATIEGGFVVAMSFDDYVAQRQAEKALNTKALVVRPDKNAQSDQHIITGTKDELIQQTQSILTTARIMSGKDVGEIAASPLSEVVNSGWSRYTLIIHYRDKQQPPFADAARSQIKIPHAKLGITWARLKQDFRPYTWGPKMGGVILEDGRQIVVYATTTGEIREMIAIGMRYTDQSIHRWLNFSDGSEQSLDRRKSPRLMYPYKAVFITKARNTITGKVVESNQTMYLWQDNPPTNDVFTNNEVSNDFN